MIYVTGDTHGDAGRFKAKEIKRLKKGDTLIVLGDFGFLWNGGKAEKKLCTKLGKKKYNILFLDGSHENYDLLKAYEICDYCGGRAQQISGRLYHLLRGEVYTIEDKRILCFGGADSLDRENREEGKTWWREETPCDADYENCLENLKKNGEIDYILTHDAPSRLSDFLHLDKDTVLYETSRLEAFFDELYKNVKHSKWAFARYHKDQRLGGSAVAVFRAVIPLNPSVYKKKNKKN